MDTEAAATLLPWQKKRSLTGKSLISAQCAQKVILFRQCEWLRMNNRVIYCQRSIEFDCCGTVSVTVLVKAVCCSPKDKGCTVQRQTREYWYLIEKVDTKAFGISISIDLGRI